MLSVIIAKVNLLKKKNTNWQDNSRIGYGDLNKILDYRIESFFYMDN